MSEHRVSIGNEQTPILVWQPEQHDFNGQQLRDGALNTHWTKADNFYPGLRGLVIESYFDQLMAIIEAQIKQTYGVSSGNVKEAYSCYSLAVAPESALNKLQAIPHFDATDNQQLAVVHYLCEPPYLGTGFFRHRVTGYEQIFTDNLALYKSSVSEQLASIDVRYVAGSTAEFDCFHQESVRFNKFIVYPASLLHSGLIKQAASLSANPVLGRLTITSFIGLNQTLNY